MLQWDDLPIVNEEEHVILELHTLLIIGTCVIDCFGTVIVKITGVFQMLCECHPLFPCMCV